jgi:hypothetical protein
MNAIVLPCLKYEVHINIIVKDFPFGFKVLHSIKLIHIYNIEGKIYQHDSPTLGTLKFLRRQVITFKSEIVGLCNYVGR